MQAPTIHAGIARNMMYRQVMTYYAARRPPIVITTVTVAQSMALVALIVRVHVNLNRLFPRGVVKEIHVVVMLIALGEGVIVVRLKDVNTML